MAKTSTSWKKGQSGNPSGRPRCGEGIVKGLADELNKRGQAGKLHKAIITRALDKNADWRLQIALYDFFMKIYKHEQNAEIETRLDEIERRLDESKNKTS